MSSPWNEPQALGAMAQLSSSFLDPAESGLPVEERIRRLQMLIATGHLDSLAHSLPMLLNLKSKPYTLDGHFPFEELFRFKMPSSIVYRTARQVSKSRMRTNTAATYAQNGRPLYSDDLTIGRRLLAEDGAFRWTTCHIIGRHENQPEAGLRITTRLGAVLDLTRDHELRTLYGYTEAQEIKPDAKIAALRCGGMFTGDANVPREQIIRTASAHSHNHEVERLPAWVFDLSRDDAILFLSTLWARSTIGAHAIHHTCASKKLAQDVKALLTKFGVPSSIGCLKEAYRVRIETEQGRQLFWTTFAARAAQTNKAAPAYDNDIIWDSVTAIEPLPPAPTWDIETDGQHNYITDGVISHNSTSLSAHGVVTSISIPNFTTLYVTPLFEQIRRFSTMFMQPFIDQSPIKSLLCGTETVNSVLHRSFKNRSKMIFSFAYLNADRIRGCSSDKCAIDEIQDMPRENLAIIRETMSASEWALQQFTGTPKTLDNTLESLWQESSQASWFTPCLHCTTNGRPTWNIASLEFHLEGMIGPYRTDISEKAPATICYKCGGIISPRMGRWVHRYPERVWSQAGYHVPQLILPLHYASPSKWSELLAKQAGRGSTPLNVFYNEVLGESYDTSAKLVTLTELNAVSNLGPNTEQVATSKLAQYRMRILGVDWGGGGAKQVSFTTIALVGVRWDGKMDVIWGKRLLTPHDHLREAHEVMHYWQVFRPDVLAHDYTGAGSLRETFLVQAGVPARHIMPCQYVRSASQKPCFHVAPTPQHPRSHYRIDKSRTLLLTCAMIKCGCLHFFNKDHMSDEDPGLIRDFLALVEDKVVTIAAGEIYRIGRQEGFSDDFAQAVNLGCVAAWYRSGVWPKLDQMAQYTMTDAQLRAASPEQDSDWDDEVL